MQRLLVSSRSAVMVNGVQGPWITCKKGLRQGDALSPYLFLLVADLLQKLVKADGGIRHPLVDGPCPILQYADDTIILIRGVQEDAARLKQVLDTFAAATGLVINFSKSTVTPMHVNRRAFRTCCRHSSAVRRISTGLPGSAPFKCQAEAVCFCSPHRQGRPLPGWMESHSAQQSRSGCLDKLGA